MLAQGANKEGGSLPHAGNLVRSACHAVTWNPGETTTNLGHSALPEAGCSEARGKSQEERGKGTERQAQ